MKIRILGGGWYGCHLATTLIGFGHEVALWESSDQLFNGASGANPARLHLGFHYPRSKLTRAMSQEHYVAFMLRYSRFTRTVPINIYAIAESDSVIDFGTYCQVLKGEVEFIRVDVPSELGLQHVEGALLTGERHIVISKIRKHFTAMLKNHVMYQCGPADIDSDGWDYTIDCTFCALDSANIDRYEPCITTLLRGPVDKAVTIMDGPFPSIYPWDEEEGLCSLTSAKYTPFARCATRAEAEAILGGVSVKDATKQSKDMLAQIRYFYPEAESYEAVGYKLSIRAMPRSGSDARLVDVIRVGKRALRVRAGKIDAIEHAATVVLSMMKEGA